MAHEITIRPDGTAEAAFAMEPAWHGLGVVIDHAMSSEEAIKAAQLDWIVELAPLKASWNNVDRKVTNAFATVRTDTGDVLGIVSHKYKVVQNYEAFCFLDSLVEEGQMTYESAFSLKGGKKVVLLARLPSVDQIVPDDLLQRYLLLSLSHDGSSGILFGPTSVRVVCANTYALALQEGYIRDIGRFLPRDIRGTQTLSVRHMGNVADKLHNAKLLLRAVNVMLDDFAGLARRLAQYRLTDEQFRHFLDVMCPKLPPYDPDYTQQRAREIEATRASIHRLFYECDRQNLAGIERSAWAAFCAVAEHIDHLPRRGATAVQRAEARFNMALYGPGRSMKRRALETLQRLVLGA
ncbi:MAG: hypothetical protein KatS3mg110_3223 [Pirellulaceae bacterium]|nr:MAG: hypothetical protein KatS3mg110_3223 [Pirellulaceae bacterium]